MERDVAENIISDAARLAHDELLKEMPNIGLTPSHNSGHVKGVRLHDVHNRYLFAWVPAQRHLLFYIRKPALNVAPQLHHSVSKLALQSGKNPAGETTIRLENLQEAKSLLQWLRENLPLAEP